jgi:glycolate oxidase FAD binding subunit
MRALRQVIDYPARDMTITVEAGIPIAELQGLLAAEHQRLPIDVPRADLATLGGSIAANVSGPRRFAHGTFRDYVIGLTTINDEGQETKAGGRVVKNVAGYDLCKLHTGALGTLGINSQVTLKLRPVPELSALVVAGVRAGKLTSVLDAVHASRTRPVAIDVLNASAAQAVRQTAGVVLPGAPWLLVVGFEGNADSVTWQMRQVLGEMGSLAVEGVEARAGSASDALWQALVELAAPPDATVSFKANLLSSAVADFCEKGSTRAGVCVHAHGGSGIVHLHLGSTASLEESSSLVRILQPVAAAAAGNLVVMRAPAAWKKHLPVWGLPRGDAWLMRKVKEQLDPRGVFNPGRFVEGT